MNTTLSRLVAVCWIAGIACVHAQFATLAYHKASTSSDTRVEQRTDLGGSIVCGMQVLSTLDGAVTCDGKFISSPWDTTACQDGWKTLKQGDGTVQVAVLNSATVAFEEGRLSKTTTWGDSAVHIVRNDVYVPKGMTLSINEGTCVKFTQDTRIIVENGGKLSVTGASSKLVYLCMATDDLFGGDTDMCEAVPGSANPEVVYVHDNGTFTSNGLFCCAQCQISPFATYLSIASEVQAVEQMAVVRIPVAIASGSQTSDFAVVWKAYAGTACSETDYLLASGSLAWNSTQDGTKFIEIPILDDDVLEQSETFTVKLVGSVGANVQWKSCTVTVLDSVARPSALAWQTTSSEAGARLEQRVDFGGCIVTGQQEISTEEGRVTCEGKDISSPWNTTALEDGWTTLTQNNAAKQVAVLNTPAVVCEEGRLSETTLWDDTAVHLVRNDVYVPKDITLSIAPSTKIKFTADTRIIVEHGGILCINGESGKIVKFGMATDDSFGGDTDMRDGNPENTNPEVVYLYDNASSTGSGHFIFYQCQYSGYSTSVAITPAVQAFEQMGVVRIPVSIASGTQATSFAVSWEAFSGTASYGSDYLSDYGVVSWASTNSGTQFIEIPLKEDSVLEDAESFSVKLTVSSGVNVTSKNCAVTILDSFLAASEGEVMALDISGMSEVNALEDEEARQVGGGAVGIAFSPKWSEKDAASGVQVSVKRVEDGAETILVANVVEEGVYSWETSGLANGTYQLTHKTLNAAGEALEQLAATLYISGNYDQAVHSEALSKSETWKSGTVHVVQDWIWIPAGVTLTMEPGAVVKFMENTGITADGTLKAEGVVFTSADDDSVGGDADMNGPAETDSWDWYGFLGNGTMLVNGATVRHLTTLPWTVNSISVTGDDEIPQGGAADYVCMADCGQKGKIMVSPNWTLSPQGKADVSADGRVSNVNTSPSDCKVALTAAFDGKTASKDISLKGNDTPLSAIAISGDASVEAGGNARYVCTATFVDGKTADVTPVWNLSSQYASVTADGVVTNNNTQAETKNVTLNASFTSGGVMKTASKRIMLVGMEKELTAIAISGNGVIVNGGTASYTCIATYSDKSTATVVPDWSLSAAAFATVSGSGLVTNTNTTSTAQTVTLTASHGGKTADKSIMLEGKQPPATVGGIAMTSAGFLPGGSCAVACTLTYPADAENIGFELDLPTGWSFASSTATGCIAAPLDGDEGMLGWAWAAVPDSPCAFSVVLNVPADADGAAGVTGRLYVSEELGCTEELTLQPILTHSADYNHDWKISMQELLRVVTHYNAREGNIRTGEYHVDAAGKDGYAPGSGMQTGGTHSADYNYDWRISMPELLRVVTHYNAREGNIRTGEYHADSSGKDGYAPGPATRGGAEESRGGADASVTFENDTSADYVAGGTVHVKATVAFSGSCVCGWEFSLPAGWALEGTPSTSPVTQQVSPEGTEGMVEIFWMNPVTDSFTVEFDVSVPQNAAGTYEFLGKAYVDDDEASASLSLSAQGAAPVAKSSLVVSLAPAEAVLKGAAWCLDNGEWLDGNDCIVVEAGTYQLSFKHIDGWTTPATRQVTVSAGKDETIAATYVKDVAELNVRVKALWNTGIEYVLTAEAKEDATDAYDSAEDLLVPPLSSPSDGYAWFLSADGQMLQWDARRLASEMTWTLAVNVMADEVVTLTWDASSVPSYMQATMSEGTDTVNMCKATQKVLDAVGLHTLTISVARSETFTYELASGWNLIAPTVELDAESTAELMKLSPMTYDVESGNYSALESVPAGTACWVYASSECEITVSGKPVETWTMPDLASGRWMFIGIVKDTAMPQSTIVWEWTTSGYRQPDGDTLKAGKAYWMYSWK